MELFKYGSVDEVELLVCGQQGSSSFERNAVKEDEFDLFVRGPLVPVLLNISDWSVYRIKLNLELHIEKLQLELSLDLG